MLIFNFYQLLFFWYYFYYFSIIKGIIENYAVVFYVYVKNETISLMDYDQEKRQFGALTYYIPAIIV